MSGIHICLCWTFGFHFVGKLFQRFKSEIGPCLTIFRFIFEEKVYGAY